MTFFIVGWEEDERALEVEGDFFEATMIEISLSDEFCQYGKPKTRDLPPSQNECGHGCAEVVQRSRNLGLVLGAKYRALIAFQRSACIISEKDHPIHSLYYRRCNDRT